ncbi:hypothetical protein KO465_04045 [Candidatus Micrarchaeota archaeon]|nr:hypothetical protein [Candidatus Micrarchaeota archaeon]
MKKIHILMVLVGLLFFGCVDNNETFTNQTNMSDDDDILQNSEIEKLEIIHFHSTNQCYSCITVGDYAEETINTYFKYELQSGLIEFKHINGELPENRDLVTKYGATGSSLWLGTYVNEEFYAEQNIDVWYKINNKNEYMNYLKGVIENKLKG